MIASGSRKKIAEPDHAGQHEHAPRPDARAAAPAPVAAAAPGGGVDPAGAAADVTPASWFQRSVYFAEVVGRQVGELDELREDVGRRVQARVLD